MTIKWAMKYGDDAHTSNKAEINRYGARALKKIAKNKILNLQTNKNFSSIS